MAPKRSKKDFLSFILATQTNDQLARDFFSKRTVENLYKFFKANNYTDIEKPECAVILKARNAMKGVRIPSRGEDPCPNPRQGY